MQLRLTDANFQSLVHCIFTSSSRQLYSVWYFKGSTNYRLTIFFPSGERGAVVECASGKSGFGEKLHKVRCTFYHAFLSLKTGITKALMYLILALFYASVALVVLNFNGVVLCLLSHNKRTGAGSTTVVFVCCDQATMFLVELKIMNTSRCHFPSCLCPTCCQQFSGIMWHQNTSKLRDLQKNKTAMRWCTDPSEFPVLTYCFSVGTGMAVSPPCRTRPIAIMLGLLVRDTVSALDVSQIS